MHVSWAGWLCWACCRACMLLLLVSCKQVLTPAGCHACCFCLCAGLASWASGRPVSAAQLNDAFVAGGDAYMVDDAAVTSNLGEQRRQQLACLPWHCALRLSCRTCCWHTCVLHLAMLAA